MNFKIGEIPGLYDKSCKLFHRLGAEYGRIKYLNTYFALSLQESTSELTNFKSLKFIRYLSKEVGERGIL